MRKRTTHHGISLHHRRDARTWEGTRDVGSHRSARQRGTWVVGGSVAGRGAWEVIAPLDEEGRGTGETAMLGAGRGRRGKSMRESTKNAVSTRDDADHPECIPQPFSSSIPSPHQSLLLIAPRPASLPLHLLPHPLFRLEHLGHL